MNDLLETWQAQNAINLYFLSVLPEGGLEAVGAPERRPVGEIFYHICKARLIWVHHTAPDLTEPFPWFNKEPQLTINAPELKRALEQTGDAVAALIERRFETGRVERFPGSLTSFVGYMISHECFHWGEIDMALTQSNLSLPEDIAMGIWRGWWGREVSPSDKE